MPQQPLWLQPQPQRSQAFREESEHVACDHCCLDRVGHVGTHCFCSGPSQFSPWPQHWGRDSDGVGKGLPGSQGKAGWEDKRPPQHPHATGYSADPLCEQLLPAEVRTW